MHRLTAILALAVFAVVASPQGPQLANLREVPFTQVKIVDAFFAPRRALNRSVTLEHALHQLEVTGTLPNFDRAAAGAHDGHQGFVYQDSDAYKAIEAAAFALADAPDPALDSKLDAIIARIAKSQQPDGYLNSWFTVKEPEKRFLSLRDNHELYCAGHLFEAAVAHFRATGKRSLLDVATRYADLLCNTFGDGPGKRPGYCGHPEAELALVKLADVTGKAEYFALAQYFVNARGSRFFATERGEDPNNYDGTYWLDHVPLRELGAIAGHAVRATYLMSGAVDVAARTNDQALLRTVDRVWRNTIEKNVFVTGGIGPSAGNEGFTHDFDLPMGSAYQESCASIGMVMWAWRLCLLYADARYADEVETALYNAIPAGVQLDGKKFFYVNPLASRGDHHRREWFGCACCPPNLARTFAAVGSYAYATGPSALYVNLYLQGAVRAKIGEAAFDLDVATDYPWQGNVTLTVTSSKPLRANLCLRIPGWCEGASASINRELGKDSEISNGYCVLSREWRQGDKVELRLPMTVRRLEADPRAEALRGRVAFARGPVVYCAEQTDQKVPLDELVVPPGADVKMNVEPKLLGGVVQLTVDALQFPPQLSVSNTLYRSQPRPKPVPLVMVPYAVWDNRTAGPMAVWFRQTPPLPRGRTPQVTAKVSMSFVSANCDPEGVRDGEETLRSSDTPARSTHWWPHKGTAEWIQYDWQTSLRLDACKVYWFDDTGRGECRLPKQARLSFLDGEQWKPVPLLGDGLPIATDRWCEVKFAPIATRALRLDVELQPDFAAGVIEWLVHEIEDGK